MRKKLIVFFTAIVLCMAFTMEPTQCLASNTIYGHVIYGGMEFTADTRICISDNGLYSLTLFSDGDLCLDYHKEIWGNYAPIYWSTDTRFKGVARCIMQKDGNLVLYSADNKPVLASNTVGNLGAVCSLQDDGNLVIYKDNRAIWASNTAGKCSNW